ncbi:Maleylacetate reductase [Yonghaparkia sp. Soil809]|nr:Maleylacetate reductase [Yonghaparkia sp. Soil809]
MPPRGYARAVEFRYASLPHRVIFGAGSSRTSLAAEVEALGAERLMVIASDRDTALVDELLAPWRDRVAVRFTGVRPHVPDSVAAEARRMAVDHRVDGLVSIGGGSTTGTAKIVALTTELPIIAVPTTYAGSEMTPMWGMTTAARKETGVDRRVLPATVVYDSDLVATLPVDLAVASGLNAMAHCVEAYWTEASNPIVRLIATEGVQALAEGLRGLAGTERASGASAADAGTDTAAARERLLYGSFLAGMAFATAGSGLHHKICHALGGAFDLPHAQTHAVVLPHVLAFNAVAAPESAAMMARALGADDAVAGLRDLASAIGAPRGLAELGLTREQLTEAIDLVAGRLPIANPRPVDRADVEAILTGAFSG